MVQKSPNLMPAKFEVLIRGPVNSVSYFTVYTFVFEQQLYKEHNYQCFPQRWLREREWPKYMTASENLIHSIKHIKKFDQE